MGYIVYVKTNENGDIVAINSNEFLKDTSGWIEIDRGNGDKYHHAQGNYFEKPIANDYGVLRYKLENGVIVERTSEEMAEDYDVPIVNPTDTERIDALEKRSAQLEESLDMLLSGVTSDE